MNLRNVVGIICIIVGVMIIFNIISLPGVVHGELPEVMVCVAKKDSLGFIDNFVEISYNGDIVVVDESYKYLEVCVVKDLGVTGREILVGIKFNTIPGYNELTPVAENTAFKEDIKMEDYLAEHFWAEYTCYATELPAIGKHGVRVRVNTVDVVYEKYGYIQYTTSKPFTSLNIIVGTILIAIGAIIIATPYILKKR